MPTPPTNVVVHPLVLLSVVDHYNRVAKDSRRRVVGVLLGETWKGSVDITNSFAGTRVIHQSVALNRVVVGSTFQLPAAAAISPLAWRVCLVLRVLCFHQFRLKRSQRTRRHGTWTTLTWRVWHSCSRRSMVKCTSRTSSRDTLAAAR